jgi:hypothetical protein
VSRWTPHLQGRVLKLHSRGLSLRAIEAELAREGTPISHVSVGAIIKAAKARDDARAARGGEGDGAGEEPGGQRGRGRARPRAVREEEPAQAEVGAAEEVELRVELPPLPDDASLAARMVYAELVEVRDASRAVYERVRSGEFPLSQWVQAKTHVLRLVKALGDLVPPPPPDPSKDPTNIACREMTHAQIIRLIRTAQQRRGHLCAVCLDRDAVGA